MSSGDESHHNLGVWLTFDFFKFISECFLSRFHLIDQTVLSLCKYMCIQIHACSVYASFFCIYVFCWLF